MHPSKWDQSFHGKFADKNWDKNWNKNWKIKIGIRIGPMANGMTNGTSAIIIRSSRLDDTVRYSGPTPTRILSIIPSGRIPTTSSGPTRMMTSMSTCLDPRPMRAQPMRAWRGPVYTEARSSRRTRRTRQQSSAAVAGRLQRAGASSDRLASSADCSDGTTRSNPAVCAERSEGCHCKGGERAAVRMPGTAAKHAHRTA